MSPSWANGIPRVVSALSHQDLILATGSFSPWRMSCLRLGHWVSLLDRKWSSEGRWAHFLGQWHLWVVILGNSHTACRLPAPHTSPRVTGTAVSLEPPLESSPWWSCTPLQMQLLVHDPVYKRLVDGSYAGRRRELVNVGGTFAVPWEVTPALAGQPPASWFLSYPSFGPRWAGWS